MTTTTTHKGKINMKTIKYSHSEVSRDPRNPLVDIHEDDERWYLNTLKEMLGEISNQGQVKDSYAWTQLITRRPKHLAKGRLGPNSVLSTVTGLLYNYLDNTARYGVCRISKRQQADFEFCCLLFNAIDSNRFSVVTWQETLFSQNGVSF